MSDISELNKKVDKILFYLHNDEGTGTKGLIADFADHKEEFRIFVSRYKTEQAVKKAKVGIISAIASAIVTFLIWLSGKIIN